MEEVNLFASILNELGKTQAAMRAVLKTELTSADINEIQAMMIYGIGNKTLSATDIRASCYTGLNASYNIRELIRLGYISKESAGHDRRSVLIRLTVKGIKMLHVITAILDNRQKHIIENGRSREQLLELFIDLRLLQTRV